MRFKEYVVRVLSKTKGVIIAIIVLTLLDLSSAYAYGPLLLLFMYASGPIRIARDLLIVTQRYSFLFGHWGRIKLTDGYLNNIAPKIEKNIKLKPKILLFRSTSIFFLIF